MNCTYTLIKHCLSLTGVAISFFSPNEGYSQVTFFSENFDGTVQPYTANASYTNANCSNYVTFNNNDPSVCGGSFCCSPVITSASGSGNFLFEGTNTGPSYAGAMYQTTINGTMIAGNTFTISFKVWLADNTNPSVLVPQINGTSVGAAITPTSTTGWQQLTWTFTPAANISLPVFSIYNSTSNGLGNDFGVDDILITATVPTAFVLALDFTGFSATAANDKVLLRWQTGPGSNTVHFTVQESTDGTQFKNIGDVASTGQAGIYTYQFLTGSETNGLHYYRLAGVDIDGVSTHSEIRTVALNNPKQLLQLLTNPVLGGRLTLAYSSTTSDLANLRIFSTDGKVLQSQSNMLHSGYNSMAVDVTAFRPGVYIVQLNGNSGVIDYVKFVKP